MTGGEGWQAISQFFTFLFVPFFFCFENVVFSRLSYRCCGDEIGAFLSQVLSAQTQEVAEITL